MSKPLIAIVDCHLGNMFSVERACEHVGLAPVVTSDRSLIASADAVVLPGMGAFGEAMKNLNERDLVGPLKDFVATGKPFLGICLGMQLLFSQSEEFGAVQGLDIIPGKVTRFPSRGPSAVPLRIPHIGWAGLRRPADRVWTKTPLDNVADGEHMYFVHSYFVTPVDPTVVLCSSAYEGFEFCSGVGFGNVFAFQFHPEKSAAKGLEIYAAFSQLITASR